PIEPVRSFFAETDFDAGYEKVVERRHTVSKRQGIRGDQLRADATGRVLAVIPPLEPVMLAFEELPVIGDGHAIDVGPVGLQSRAGRPRLELVLRQQVVTVRD